MPQKIILTVIQGGIACQSGLPLDTEIEIRDYDCPGDVPNLKEDEDGDTYQEIIIRN